MKGRNPLGLLQRSVLFHTRLHILPRVSREIGQSSTEFKSKLIVGIADGSGKYKLIECKGDSSVACIFKRFICPLFGVVLTACYELYNIHREKKPGNFNRSECLKVHQMKTTIT